MCLKYLEICTFFNHLWAVSNSLFDKSISRGHALKSIFSLVEILLKSEPCTLRFVPFVLGLILAKN